MVTIERQTFGGFLLFTALVLSSIVYGPAPARAADAGERAPDFKLASTMGGDVSLSDYRNKKWVLLEFYGLDFAPT